MKLGYASEATQEGRVIGESSDKMWPIGEGNGKPFQYSSLENPMNSMKRQKEDPEMAKRLENLPKVSNHQ